MIPNKKTARTAGLFFLLMVVSGLFAEIFFRQKLFTANDAAATADNILSNVFLYRAGITSDIIMSVCYLFTALALYRLFVSADKNTAALMVVFAAAGSILLLFNIQNEFAPLTILSGNGLSAFSPGQLQSLAMLSYTSYLHGYVIGQIFFGLWVLPLGFLIVRSGFIPKVFGILFVIEAVLALLSVFIHFLMPNEAIEMILLIPGTIAELSFMLWLLIRGINESKLPVQNNKL